MGEVEGGGRSDEGEGRHGRGRGGGKGRRGKRGMGGEGMRGIGGGEGEGRRGGGDEERGVEKRVGGCMEGIQGIGDRDEGGRAGGREGRRSTANTKSVSCTNNEFYGQLVPPCYIVVSEDILGNLLHVLGVLLPQNLDPVLVALLEGLLHSTVLLQQLQDHRLGVATQSLPISGGLALYGV